MPRWLAHRLAQPAPGQASLVERVAGLVQDPHQGGDQLVLAVAGGDADVARACRRRTGACSRRAGRRRSRNPAGPSARGRTPSASRSGNGPFGRSGAGKAAWRARTASRQRRQLGARGGRTAARRRRRADRAGTRRAGHRRVTGPSAAPVDSRLLAHEPDDLGQLGRQHGEIGLGAGLAPKHLAACGGARHRLDQRRLERVGVPVPAPHLAQVGRLPGIEVGLAARPRPAARRSRRGSAARGRSA